MAEDPGFEHMVGFLQSQDLGHMGLAGGDGIYVIPVNYTYSRGRILVHCALEGKKLDMIRANPNVCFTVARQEGHPTPHAGDACDLPWESVICWGQARVVDDLEERRAILTEFQVRYGTQAKPRGEATPAQAAQCGAIEIVVARMTGRTAARDGNPAVHLDWSTPGDADG